MRTKGLDRVTEATYSFLAQPVHITLTRTTKGYTWEVSVHTSTLDEARKLVKDTDDWLKADYGVQT